MQWLLWMDQMGLEWVQQYCLTPVGNVVMPFVSTLGNKGLIWIALAVVLLCIPKYRKQGLVLLLALGFSCLVGEGIIKHLVARGRPFWDNPELPLLITPPSGYSFPSGHTMSSFTAATVLWNENRKWGIAAAILAVMIGFSRIYLSVHYPSDVLSGAVLGVICGTLAWRVYLWVEKKRRKESQ